ncbi:MAG: hypothetical protein ABFE07_11220 [Armatimonadia bacterium]
MITEKQSPISIAVALLLIPFCILLAAYTLKTLWWWFVVPLGVPPVGMAHAYGLSTIVALMRYTDWKAVNEGKALESVMRSLGVNGMALLCGYIVHRIMLP